MDDNWQPIETAPKDGTPILAWPVKLYKSSIPYVGCYGSLEHNGKTFFGLHEIAGECWHFFDEVTHWMPQPNPPTTNGKGD